MKTCAGIWISILKNVSCVGCVRRSVLHSASACRRTPNPGTIRAKLSRNEWKNVLTRLGPNEFKASPSRHLSKAEFAQRLSVKDMHEPESLPRCGKLLEKSVHAALSAIEVYNKPDFKYREESFCI